MKTRHSFLATFTAAMLVTGMILGLSLLSTKTALAQSQTSQTANHFGKGASQLGQSGEMGEHSKAGGAAGQPPFDQDGTPGRNGIGNVGNNVLCPNSSVKLKPGQTADVLNGGACPP